MWNWPHWSVIVYLGGWIDKVWIYPFNLFRDTLQYIFQYRLLCCVLNRLMFIVSLRYTGKLRPRNKKYSSYRLSSTSSNQFHSNTCNLFINMISYISSITSINRAWTFHLSCFPIVLIWSRHVQTLYRCTGDNGQLYYCCMSYHKASPSSFFRLRSVNRCIHLSSFSSSFAYNWSTKVTFS